MFTYFSCSYLGDYAHLLQKSFVFYCIVQSTISIYISACLLMGHSMSLICRYQSILTVLTLKYVFTICFVRLFFNLFYILRHFRSSLSSYK